MVLERLVSIRDALKRPWWMFLIGGVISVTCLFISYFVFQSSVGMFSSLLVTISMTPFMLNLAMYQEAKEEQEHDFTEMNLLQRHKDIIKIYTVFFAGMILSLSILFMILPSSISQKLFQDQVNEINAIRGNFISYETFGKILTNNLGVLFLSFIFSFVFGAGAVFILSWNATVLATAIGMSAKGIGGIKALPMATLMFFPHGSLEILAYFIGGIAGGLVSALITRRHSRNFWFIIKDSSLLMLASVALLITAGLIEAIEIGL
jgi:uncharacterized membrane protein SpoIIM required for sporulation